MHLMLKSTFYAMMFLEKDENQQVAGMTQSRSQCYNQILV